MEKLNFFSNGIVKLPPGFRFHPTDQELVLQYLRRKVLCSPLPASIIPEVDVCRADPWDLPGDKGQERYFFSTREAKYPNGNRSNRATQSGYWKATGKDKAILIAGCRLLDNAGQQTQVVGMKKTLVFYRGKPPHGSRTDWIMHEYRLPQGFAQSTGEDWVLCRIFLKKRGSKSAADDEECKEDDQNVKNADTDDTATIRDKSRPVYYDFMTTKDKAKPRMTTDLNVAPSSSCSGSSGVTEEASDDLNRSPEDPEESSSYNSFSNLMRKSHNNQS